MFGKIPSLNLDPNGSQTVHQPAEKWRFKFEIKSIPAIAHRSATVGQLRRSASDQTKVFAALARLEENRDPSNPNSSNNDTTVIL